MYTKELAIHYSKLKYPHNEHNDFYESKIQNHNDPLPHLIHADRLEELGAPNLAKHIRDYVDLFTKHGFSLPKPDGYSYISDSSFPSTILRNGPYTTPFELKYNKATDGTPIVSVTHFESPNNKHGEFEHVKDQRGIDYGKVFTGEDKDEEAKDHFETLQHELIHYIQPKENK